MRTQIGLFLVLIACIIGAGHATPALGQVVITPATPPVVNQGRTFQFTANGTVTWSCPGCAGSINPATGVYTAPAVVNAQQSYGGCQLLPNDHIYNTRIDSLPVNANSAAWIAGSGTIPLNYFPEWSVNYINGSTPAQTMTFLYTPANNGSFLIPQYPKARVQSGWFTYINNATAGATGMDRHFFMINPANCTMQELYDYYAAGYNAKCPTCTSQSGVKYKGSDYALPAQGATDAAGMFFMPLTLRIQELERAIATGDTIKHALRMTLQNDYICGTNNANACGGNAQGTRHIWPATAEAFAGSGVIPYGARFRLKASFDISGFSSGAQVLLTQLKQYGLILADGGYGWQVGTEDTYRQDMFAGGWAAGITPVGDIFRELAYAKIAPSNFEAVDESSLMVSPSSGATKNSETVVATNAQGATAARQVVLTGVALNLPKDAMSIQAGMAAQQLVAYISGSSNTGVNWTMNPAVGTLTSSGLYTPPAAVTTTSVTTVTAVSAANPGVSASMQLSVFPQGAIRIAEGWQTPYTDSQGNVWQPRLANGGGGDNSSYGQAAVAGTVTGPDSKLYQRFVGAYNDLAFEFLVPNGIYLVTEKYAENSGTVAGQRIMSLEAQGVIQYPNVDIAALAGDDTPKDFTFNVTVTNNDLQLVNRYISGAGPMLSALQIVPVSGINANPAVLPPPSVKIEGVK
jgi:hypothetical protein